MQSASCIKCGTVFQMWVRSDTIKCKECGATYEVEDSVLGDQHVEYSYKFVGFSCMHSSAMTTCDNKCPASNMYCKEHIGDEYFATANNSIEYAEKRLIEAKEKLERLEESKKIYLIQEVSGIDEDNSV